MIRRLTSRSARLRSGSPESRRTLGSRDREAEVFEADEPFLPSDGLRIALGMAMLYR